jgi:hypothetical protein
MSKDQDPLYDQSLEQLEFQPSSQWNAPAEPVKIPFPEDYSQSGYDIRGHVAELQRRARDCASTPEQGLKVFNDEIFRVANIPADRLFARKDRETMAVPSWHRLVIYANFYRDGLYGVESYECNTSLGYFPLLETLKKNLIEYLETARNRWKSQVGATVAPPPIPILELASSRRNLVNRQADGSYWCVAGLDPLVAFLKEERNKDGVVFSKEFFLKNVRDRHGNPFSPRHIENIMKN